MNRVYIVVFFVASLLGSQPVYAIDGRTVFDGMLTTTNPSVVKTARRVGFVGGSVRFRTKIYDPVIIAFRPPSVKNGCGGFDFFGGSFSLLNTGEITQIARNIAAGAAAYAFDLAMDALCSSCMNVMKSWQKQINEFNEFFSNSCQKTYDALKNNLDDDHLRANIAGPFVEALSIEDASKNGTFDSPLASIFGENSSDPDSGTTAAGRENASVNTTWAAIRAGRGERLPSSALAINNHDPANLLLSLIGADIVKADGSGSDDQANVEVIPANARLTIRELIESDNATIEMFICPDPATAGSIAEIKCLDPSVDTINNFDGIKTTVFKALDGLEDGSPGAVLRQEHLVIISQYPRALSTIRQAHRIGSEGLSEEIKVVWSELIAADLAKRTYDELLQYFEQNVSTNTDELLNAPDAVKEKIASIRAELNDVIKDYGNGIHKMNAQLLMNERFNAIMVQSRTAQ